MYTTSSLPAVRPLNITLPSRDRSAPKPTGTPAVILPPTPEAVLTGEEDIHPVAPAATWSQAEGAEPIHQENTSAIVSPLPPLVPERPEVAEAERPSTTLLPAAENKEHMRLPETTLSSDESTRKDADESPGGNA
jgi:hypothetical protein